MKRLQWILCGLMMALLSPAFAQQQALITINPNLYTAGQNISNVNPGAQLLSFSTVPNPDPNNPGTRVPQYLPVYAQPVDPSCNVGVGIPCAIGGNLAIGFSSTTVPSTIPILWGDEDVAAECLAEFGAVSFCDGSLDFEVLRVNFTTPTDFAAAAIGYFPDDASVIQAFEAFDSSGNSLGRCVGPFQFPLSGPLPPQNSDPPGCATSIGASTTSGWGLFTISRPTADISFVLIGGFGNNRPIAQVLFDSPVSVQLAGLLAAVQGVGPGKSLANTAAQAQANYATGDILTTCSLLASLVSQVNAQDGKHLDHLSALQLLSTATAIETGIGCK